MKAKKITPFIERQHNGYIIGYRYHNGMRIVSCYVVRYYKSDIVYSLDYTHARHYKSIDTARNAVKNIYGVRICLN